MARRRGVISHPAASYEPFACPLVTVPLSDGVARPLRRPLSDDAARVPDNRASSQLGAHFETRDDAVDQPAFEQKLGGLEALGQILARRFLSTRAPAKPIIAFGSAMFRSPSVAKLAVTPPMVGCVRMEMKGSCAGRMAGERAAGLGHLHQAEHALVHPRAAGRRKNQHRHPSSVARSMARVIFSPITEPIEPPRKLNSITATETGLPLDLAQAADHALLEAGLLPIFLQLFGVAGRPGEFQDIDGRDAGVVFLPMAFIEQVPEPLVAR